MERELELGEGKITNVRIELVSLSAPETEGTAKRMTELPLPPDSCRGEKHPRGQAAALRRYR